MLVFKAKPDTMTLVEPTNNPVVDTTNHIDPHAHNLPIASTHPTINPSSSNSSSQLAINATSINSGGSAHQHISATTNHSNTSTMGHSNSPEAAGPWFEMPKVENFVDLFSICCSTAVIFGGLVPYIPQYLKIKRSMNSDGFSTYVCLTLLLANILRIMFWFGHRFELPLLIQSFVMIAGMLAMMEICIRVKTRGTPYTISAIGINSNQRRRYVNGSESGGFWDWDDYYSYVKFLSLFTFILSLLTYLLKDNYLYVESLGFVAVFTESMLGMPQLLRNYAKKSTAGMSVEMVVMWLSGDLFKTLYFILRRAPAQFYVCGSIQVIVDILILGQVLWYRRPNVTYRKLPKST